MFSNRLKKNSKHLSRWLRKENIHCYRLYDADIPEYALAIDVYEGKQKWVHVQEYQAPKTIDPEKASHRLHEATETLIDLLNIAPKQCFIKTRRQQKGKSQYEKLGDQQFFHEVIENENRLWVNFEDYLDTGLFLDHRTTRCLLSTMSQGKRFLNLFAYTGSATVHAASGGALSTTTVDMSKTYLDWAKRNMSLNQFNSPAHQYIQANCIEWLENQSSQYDLIFLDPPSFSTSKRMKSTFDVQRDHVGLIKNTVKLLDNNGVLIFSNNLRHFKMDHQAFHNLKIDDISKQTLPKDFERNPRIHNCWRIRPI